jgi:hypothetical protein
MVPHHLRGANRRWRYDDLNQSGGHVIDEAGEKPPARQRRNSPEQSNVDDHRGAGIHDLFRLEFTFLYLKKVRQHRRVASKASDAAIGVMKYHEVVFTAASENPSRNLADSPE